MKSPHVVWKGPVRRASGLGIASREYVSALRRQGVRVTVGGYGTAPKGATLIYHHTPSSFNAARERKRFRRIILNTVWETTRVPRGWVPKMNRSDAVCVPSLQNKKALRTSGVKVPIFVVPHGVSTARFKPSFRKPGRGKSGRPFTFVSVFGFQHRKNPEALLRAYWAEFSTADHVQLIIKTNGYDRYENERWIKLRIAAYKRRLGLRKRTAPLKVIGRQLRPAQMKKLYGLGHAFVLPTRGEGVGLPFLESLASGVPVIATGWGGHMDFVSRRNAFLVRYRMESPAARMRGKHAIARPFRHLFAQKGQRWAEADLRSLRQQMRAAYRSPALCRKKGLQGRRDMLRWSWNRSGAAFKRAIQHVARSRK